MVRPPGHDPGTSRMSGERSSAELQARCQLQAIGTPARIRTPECLGVSEVPSAAWRRECEKWCAERDSNTHCSRSERDASCRLGYRRIAMNMEPSAGADPATFSLPPRCSATELRRRGMSRPDSMPTDMRYWCWPGGSNTPPPTYEVGALPDELDQPSKGLTAAVQAFRPTGALILWTAGKHNRRPMRSFTMSNSGPEGQNSSVRGQRGHGRTTRDIPARPHSAVRPFRRILWWFDRAAMLAAALAA